MITAQVQTAENDPRLSEAFYVVEATSYEHQALWCAHSADAAKHGWGTGTAPWEQDCRGLIAEVGRLADFPVNAVLSFARIHGKLVVFHHACSRVVDHEMIEEWLRKHVPAYAERHTDANNFSHCLSAVRE